MGTFAACAIDAETYSGPQQAAYFLQQYATLVEPFTYTPFFCSAGLLILHKCKSKSKSKFRFLEIQ